MPYTMLPTTEDIISDILNLVCPECGGPMGKRTKEFKCSSVKGNVERSGVTFGSVR
jgi:hypothetical protein